MKRLWAAFSSSFAVSVSAAAPAAPPMLVRDINTDLVVQNSLSINATQTSVVRLGTRIVFVATDGRSGSELWSTDGSQAGTAILRDSEPGPGSGLASGVIQVAGAHAFVFGTATGSFSRFWITDGTPGGTRLLPGPWPAPRVSFDPVRAVASGDRVFFPGDDRITGVELWVMDAASVRQVLDLDPSGSSRPESLASLGDGRVVFIAQTPATGTELWISDGTPSGTRLITELSPGSTSSTLQVFGASAGQVFFTSQQRLWRTDGTPTGTVEVRSQAGQPITGVVGLSDAAAFALIHTSSGLYAVQPGATSGTLLAATTDTSFFMPRRPHAAVGGVAIFTTDGDRQLWRSDGTPAGTFALNSAWPASTTFGSVFSAESFAYVFAAVQGQTALFRTDGTLPGTVAVPLGSATVPLAAVQGATLGDRLYFPASDAEAGVELWATDGSITGARRVADIHPPISSSFPNLFSHYETRTVFRASDSSGIEPWISDGTTLGTVPIGDIAPGPASSLPRFVGSLGSDFLFFATRPTTGYEPYVTTGSSASTRLVGDIAPGSTGSNADLGVVPFPSALIGNARILAISTPAAGSEPWRTDGTLVGTFPLADLVAGSGSSSPSGFTTAPDGASVFFVANLASGPAMMQTDGTVAGTRLAVSNPGGLRPGGRPIVVRGQLVTLAGSPTIESDLYAVNSGGYSLFADLPSSPTFVEFLAVLEAGLILRIEDGSLGDRLWLADGQTTQLVPLTVQPTPIRVAGHARSANLLFFVLSTGADDSQLWRTDGTPAGTRPVLPPIVGPTPALPRHLIGLDDGRIVFSATTPDAGFELWISDGTGPGTRPLGDIALGPLSSWPESTHFDGHRVLFSADDHTHIGRELYSWTVGPTCRCDMTGDGVISVQDIFTFLAAYFNGRGDFNDNGQTDVDDVFGYLDCWYANCP